MTIEADIVSRLTSLVSGRVYPDISPAEVARPYIVYQQAGGQAPTFLEKSVPSKKNGRFQIAVWADTRASAASINLLIEAAMVTATAFECTPLGAATAIYDEATKYRGSHQDFSVWSNR